MAMNDDEDDDPTFVERYGVWIGAALVALIAVFVLVKMSFGHESTPQRKETTFTMVNIVPPPPPPPPPPPKVEPPKQQEPPKEEEMIEAPREEVPDDKPVEEEPPADEPPPLGTGIKGDGGADGFGLKYGGGGGGGGFGKGIGGPGRKGASALAQFGRKAEAAIADALRQHPKTRSARFRLEKFKVFTDSTGRITGAKLLTSTGDRELDAIIEQQVLPGVRIPFTPPPEAAKGMVIKASAQRPN